MKVLSLLLRNPIFAKHGIGFTQASMKVLSLLLRNEKFKPKKTTDDCCLNESPELIAQECYNEEKMQL